MFGRRMERLLPLLGRADKVSLDTEALARKNARRSLVTAKKIAAGTVIRSEHLTWKRPATGISPRDIDQVIGRVVKGDLVEDELITWDMLQ